MGSRAHPFKEYLQMKDTNNILVMATANAFVSKILERINRLENRAVTDDESLKVLDQNNESTKLGLLTLTRLVGDSL